MKKVMSKFNLAALALLLLTATAMTSCKKDKNDDPAPAPSHAIVGEWDIESFTIDGVEIKGTVVLSSRIKFGEYTGANGNFEWTIVYADGSGEVAAGDYTADEEDGVVELENDNGQTLRFDYEIDGDALELSGNLDGERYELKAERD